MKPMQQIVLSLLLVWMMWVEYADQKPRIMETYPTKSVCEEKIAMQRDMAIRVWHHQPPKEWAIGRIEERSIVFEEVYTGRRKYMIFTCLPQGVTPQG